MKVITLCFWKRHQYAEAALKSLEKCTGIEDYHLVIHLDAPIVTAVKEVCDRVTFAEKTVIRSPVHRGCNRSTKRVLNRGFTMADYVIHVEEDVILAPDALLYFEWANQFQSDPSILTIGSWRHPSGWLPESGQPFPYGQLHQTKVARSYGFTCWGWSTWKDRWNVLLQNWTKGDDMTLSWDSRIEDYRRTTQQYELLPLISRAMNIGAMEGLHRGDCLLSYWAGSDGFVRDTNFQIVEV